MNKDDCGNCERLRMFTDKELGREKFYCRISKSILEPIELVTCPKKIYGGSIEGIATLTNDPLVKRKGA